MFRVAKIFLAVALGVSATHLTPETFDAATSGKAVFLKFYAPWCGHCKQMQPAWEELTAANAENKNVVVAEVNCDGEARPLCEQMEIRGFPTILHGDVNSLETYSGGRDVDSLKSFVANMKPVCNPQNIELCSEEKAAIIRDLQTKSLAELVALVAEKEDTIKAAEQTFEDELEKLKSTFEQLLKNKDDTIAKIKADGLSLMKSVRAHKVRAVEESTPKAESMQAKAEVILANASATAQRVMGQVSEAADVALTNASAAGAVALDKLSQAADQFQGAAAKATESVVARVNKLVADMS